MKTARGKIFILVLITGILLCVNTTCFAQLKAGDAAPLFELKDVRGTTHDLSRMKDKSLIIVYFFDADSRSSQDGLLSLNQLAGKFKSQLTVLAISGSPKEKVAQFARSSSLVFPVLLDTGNVRNMYHARQILPVVCIVGPGLKVLDYFQGGGKSSETMLARLAERELQRRNTMLAKAISKEVKSKSPKNVAAQRVTATVAVNEGNYKTAEEECRKLLQWGNDGDIQGKECLAQVSLKRGRYDEAFKIAQEVEKMAPERSYVNVIKGDVLYAQNRKKDAEVEYRKAAAKKAAVPYQEAVAFNRLGRIYEAGGERKKAQDSYDKAVTIDPYYVEVTTNKGLSFEKEGKWDQALKSYEQALAIDKNDRYAGVLAKRAQEMLDLMKDTEKSKRIDQLVKDLVARYKAQKDEKPPVDSWTSRPMVLTFVDFEEKGTLGERDGFITVLTNELTGYLNGSGRVKVVERVLIERLLAELNLGSSELANPETALKLGKVLAAKLIATGSILHQPGGSLLTFRLIDTETSDIPQLTTKQLGPQTTLDKELFQLNRDILKTVIAKYPLRGFVVKVTGNEAVINIGSRQGVVSGTTFDVVEDSAPIEYKGKTLSAAPQTIGQVEVVRVEPEIAFVKVVSMKSPLAGDQKIQERLNEMAAR